MNGVTTDLYATFLQDRRFSKIQISYEKKLTCMNRLCVTLNLSGERYEY